MSDVSATLDLPFLVYIQRDPPLSHSRVVRIAFNFIRYICVCVTGSSRPFASQIFNECKYAFAWQILRVTFLSRRYICTNIYCHADPIIIATLFSPWLDIYRVDTSKASIAYNCNYYIHIYDITDCTSRYLIQTICSL